MCLSQSDRTATGRGRGMCAWVGRIGQSLVLLIWTVHPATAHTREDVSALTATLAGLRENPSDAVEALYFALIESLPDPLPPGHVPDKRQRAIWQALQCASNGPDQSDESMDLSELRPTFAAVQECDPSEYVCVLCRPLSESTRVAMIDHLRTRLDLARDGYHVVRGAFDVQDVRRWRALTEEHFAQYANTSTLGTHEFLVEQNPNLGWLVQILEAPRFIEAIQRVAGGRKMATTLDLALNYGLTPGPNSPTHRDCLTQSNWAKFVDTDQFRRSASGATYQIYKALIYLQGDDTHSGGGLTCVTGSHLLDDDALDQKFSGAVAEHDLFKFVPNLGDVILIDTRIMHRATYVAAPLGKRHLVQFSFGVPQNEFFDEWTIGYVSQGMRLGRHSLAQFDLSPGWNAAYRAANLETGEVLAAFTRAFQAGALQRRVAAAGLNFTEMFEPVDRWLTKGRLQVWRNWTEWAAQNF